MAAVHPWYKHYDPEVPKTLEYPEGTVLDHFEEQAKADPGKVALVFFKKAVTYGRLAESIRTRISREAKAALGRGMPFRSLVTGPAADVPAVKVDTRRDVAVLIYTGGTTGRPKGVMLSHRANASQVKAWGQLSPADSILAVLPLFMVSG